MASDECKAPKDHVITPEVAERANKLLASALAAEDKARKLAALTETLIVTCDELRTEYTGMRSEAAKLLMGIHSHYLR